MDWTVRIFPWKDESGGLDPFPDFYIPDNWTIDDPIDASYIEQMEETEIGLVVEGWGGARLVDPETLELKDMP